MAEKHVVISGALGMIGTALGAVLSREGIRVSRLVRREARDASELSWEPGVRPLDPSQLEGVGAVVNLSGASIGRVPWTRRYRAEIVASRLQATRTLAHAIRALGGHAPHFVSASATGYYGDRPGERLTEEHNAGTTFLARLCVQWEEAAQSVGRSARVAVLRTAPVLHPKGVLKPLVPITLAGLSGPLGGGGQYWPWVSLHDEVRAICHIIAQELTGAFNITGPQPATATEIGRELARQLHRPYLLPSPRWALRAALGKEAAEGLLLPDARVAPKRLIESGFAFTHQTAEDAIASSLRN